ncbi:MAG: DUF5683 domain-containing protein [Muribaculaceae bacterium]|nr:DUF5683 domain-containing protein [Muribaculaceae bacterium]
MILVMLVSPFNIFSDNPRKPSRPQRRPDVDPVTMPDTIPLSNPVLLPAEVVEDSISTWGDSLTVQPVDSFAIVDGPSMIAAKVREDDDAKYMRQFNPDPNRAVWLSALFPGLGQVYNRRWWKLPLVVGGFMGLGYGASWNNGMLRDYTRAYNDLMDTDPSTNSYMDFFPPGTTEGSLDASWLQRTMKARKDYYRRNRDLCIISMVGVYLIAMVDAYVDASLAHFDISPELSMHVAPAFIPDARNMLPGVGLQWALNF